MLFPVLVAQSAVLVVNAPHMCASPGLQHAYATLHRSLLRAAHWLLATPPADEAAAAGEILCAAAYQPALILLGNTLVGYVAFCAELSERRAFVQRHSEAAAAGGQAALLATLRQRGRLPVQPVDYWLAFSLPAACTLLSLHLRMQEL